MAWQLDNNRPIYIQLVEQIKKNIMLGYYLPGSKVPSVRDLAQEAGVNPNTMQKALQELEREGVVYSVRTSGRFITEDESLLKQSGQAQAQQLAQQYYTNMKQMGYSLEQMKDLLNQCKDS